MVDAANKGKGVNKERPSRSHSCTAAAKLDTKPPT